MPGITRVGDPAFCPADNHFWMVFAVVGQYTSGSPNTFVNNRALVRVGDPGVHVACCGPNTFTAKSGAPKTFCNDKAVNRGQDESLHCDQSTGNTILGLTSPNTFA